MLLVLCLWKAAFQREYVTEYLEFTRLPKLRRLTLFCVTIATRSGSFRTSIFGSCRESGTDDLLSASDRTAGLQLTALQLFFNPLFAYWQSLYKAIDFGNAARSFLAESNWNLALRKENENK